MFHARKLIAAGLVAGLGAIAGCSTQGPGGPPVTSAASPVEGEWVGTDGVAISTLRGGQFSSRSAATGETLTQGTYTFRDATTIDLSFYSLRSQQNTTAACLLVGQSQMNCTLASGTRFTLNRRGAA